MRKLLLVFSLFFSFSAIAQDEAEVMEAYQAYNAAVERGDKRKARQFAAEAYEKAEAVWGASRKDTALLATNYADQLTNKKQWRKAIPVYERCVEILQQHENSLQEQNYCRAGAANAYRSSGDTEESRALYKVIIDLAEPLVEQEKWAAVQAGEAYLALAMMTETGNSNRPLPRSTIGSGETSTRIRTDGAAPEYDHSGRALAEKAVYNLGLGYDEPAIIVAQAHRIAGNYAEAEEDYIAAEQHYQAAYEILKSIRGEDHPDTITMDGRVAYMQIYGLPIYDEPEASREPSDPKCSVVVRGELEIEVCKDLRIPPYFPNKALFKNQQGFVIVKFDINPKGGVENAHIIHSWPGGIFDERTLKAVKKWKYFPPTDQYGNHVPVNDVYTQVTFVIG